MQNPEFKKILVPIAGNQTDKGALAIACNLFPQKSKRTILAVHVIPVDRSLPLDTEVETEVDRAEEILQQVEDMVKKLNCDVETDILQAREVGPAIISVAQEHAVDLIVMGLTYKTQFGSFCMGDVAPYVLKNAPCRVILDHQLDSEQ